VTLPTPLISASSDRLGGEPVFTGTRVPVRALIDYPDVSREHAVAVLELARQALTTHPSAA
jgi:uncharacterized protein (DUF433 family)